MPRTPPPTSHDVARIAGVSQPTVSRALRDDPRLSEETRLRVREARRGRAQLRPQPARSLATRSTGQIGTWSQTWATPSISRCSMRCTRLAPGRPEDACPHPRRRRPGPARARRRRPLDGVILTTTQLHSTLPAQLSERGFPSSCSTARSTTRHATSASSTTRRAPGSSPRRPLTLGHHAIAAVFGPETTSTGRDREASFRKVLADAGIELRAERWRRAPFGLLRGPPLHPGAPAPEADRPVRGQRHPRPGRLQRALRQGDQVPADITLIGFDDAEWPAAWEVFQLTTVSQDIEQMVKTSTELLLSMDRRGTRRAPGAPAGGVAGAAGAAGHHGRLLCVLDAGDVTSAG